MFTRAQVSWTQPRIASLSSLARLSLGFLRREPERAQEPTNGTSAQHLVLSHRAPTANRPPVDSEFACDIISRRHELRPTIITTNLAFKQWGTIFPGAACVAALVDRFTESCHAVDIDADSWRQKRK